MDDINEFEDNFLGQPALISIDMNGNLVGITLKHFPKMKIQISDEHKKELEKQYEDSILAVLMENKQDAEEFDRHMSVESDKGKFI